MKSTTKLLDKKKMSAYLFDWETSTNPPVLALQSANVVLSQNCSAATDVSFCTIEGQRDRF